MKKRILIIGEVVSTTKELIEKFKEEGHEVIVACKSQQASRVSHMYLDLTDLKSVSSFLKDFNKRYAYLDALLFQEQCESGERTLTSEGFDPLIAMHYLAPFMLTEGLSVSLKTEEHARIVYLISETALKGDIQDASLLFSEGKSYSNAMRMLLMYAVNMSSKLKGDHVTVNMMLKPAEEKGFIKKLFKSADHHTCDDLYYLLMSEDLRYKTSKLFSGRQVMVIPQDKIRKDEMHLLISQTKKLLRF
ncbi:hypothetical protein EZV73_05310 [Acidaminobacter sp. JC074]|uniref:hypothetical protein n=1 Tax=Acidaminobacter sp. JC074 TaxID=2530199 RepID=UPI001F0E261E|nr:hypothetical protein [Acidaminobacter sp. JC074]MCH4886974.1 hypothetical protein [Acidaminobacter sp. JC074]